MRRTLVLRKETLAELGAHELGEVVGGVTTNCDPPPTGWDCHSLRRTCYVSELVNPCLTNDYTTCVC